MLWLLLLAFFVANQQSVTLADQPKILRFPINGTEYYVAGSGYYSRDWAIDHCRLVGMVPVSFNKGEDLYTEIYNYIITQIEYPNGVGYWTSAIKTSSSSDSWIWETTGEKVAKFYWAEGEPSFAEDEVGVCMMFSVQRQGWVNDYCKRTNVGATIVCEKEIEQSE
ncbi:uncharacterized protein LOC132196072 [Neocloeon triangulifer]|uniref:uncharacterized protein LOC132196072 n=1 Tax=Neocloeon triangulifer TaxID=2078957 RepID=UPI00286EBA5B|nr:uncharacterized protein LOC132196072 [Neocloeon triangulifer]